MAHKPIRVFYSRLSQRFYASSHYRDDGNGLVTITGAKFDVTNDIASLVIEEKIEFKPALAVTDQVATSQPDKAQRDRKAAKS